MVYYKDAWYPCLPTHVGFGYVSGDETGKWHYFLVKKSLKDHLREKNKSWLRSETFHQYFHWPGKHQHQNCLLGIKEEPSLIGYKISCVSKENSRDNGKVLFNEMLITNSLNRPKTTLYEKIQTPMTESKGDSQERKNVKRILQSNLF